MNVQPAEKPETPTPQMQQVLNYIKENGQISADGIGSLLDVKQSRVYTLTKEMEQRGLLRAKGRGKQKTFLLR